MSYTAGWSSTRRKMPNDYEIAHRARKDSGQLPPSDKKTLDPGYLLRHENHMDPNTVTPEGLIRGGILEGKQPLKQT